MELIEKEIEKNEILLQVHPYGQMFTDNIISLKKALDLILFNHMDFEQSRCLQLFEEAIYNFDYVTAKKAYNRILESLPEKHFQRRVLDMQIRQFPQERKN